MLWLLASVALAADTSCELVGLPDVLQVESPSVLVLGVRHGTQPDLVRASKIVEALEERGPVTLAVDAVHHERSPIFDQLRSGQLPASSLADALRWVQDFGFAYGPYEALLSVPTRTVVAVGVRPEDSPDPSTPVQLPLGYMDVLRDAMGGDGMPMAHQDRFLTRMAGQDRVIASAALDGWDQQGVLVLLVDRLRVEGGMGVGWQLERMTTQPVQSAILAWARSPCYRGDRVWKRTPMG